jgi:PAS domain S-box-containing protein
MENLERGERRFTDDFSEVEFRELVDIIPQHIFVLGSDRNLLYTNRVSLEYYGLSLPDIQAKDARVRVVHPDDFQRVSDAAQAGFSSAAPFETEARFLRHDGQYRWFLVRLNPLSDQQGRVLRWYGTRTDIDDKKQAEARLELVIDTLPAMVAIALADGSADYVNERWLEYFGLSLEDLRNWRWPVVVHPEDALRVTDEWRAAVANGKPLEIEFRMRGTDGEYRWFVVRTVPLRDELGRIVKWYSAGHDIDDRKRAEGKLRRSEAHLTEAQKLSHTGSWVYDVRGDKYIHWSAEMYRIWRFDQEKGLPSPQTVRDRIHHEDRARAFEAKQKTIQGKVDQEVDFRIVLPDGSLRYVRLVGHPASVVSGNVIEATGTVMDVTEQHEASAALEKAFDEIKKLKDQLYKENLALKAEIDRSWMFEEIVGASPALRGALTRVSKVAPTDTTVLITGETGTGKELIAHAIHKQSRRSSRAFVNVNCAAIPASLIASELFGHEKGAFTDATQRRLGRFELADGGTVFLDEVGELPGETQVALLRVLQEREFERVGGVQTIRSDVRVIAASNRNLHMAIAGGMFRSDLFYRLNVFPIEIPPLRERADDISLLIDYFVKRFAKRLGKKIGCVDARTLRLLQSYTWPGNVRELQNVIERSIILSDSENLQVEESWLTPASYETTSSVQPLASKLARTEKELIEAALAETRGRVAGSSGAAAKLQIPATTLESKIKSLRINKHRFKAT